MSFFIMPIFINTVNWSRSEYRLLIIGLGLAFIIPGIYIMEFDPSNVCPIPKKGDNDVVKQWEQSCKNLEFQMNIGLPITLILMGISIIIVGFIRLYLNDKPTPQIKISEPKDNRTYPKGFSTSGEGGKRD